MKATTLSLLFIFAATALLCVAERPPAGPTSVRGLFQQLIASYSPEHPPELSTLERIQNLALTTTSQDVSDAMPLLSSTLRSNGNEIKIYAVAVVTAVARRPDSASLLHDYLKDITQLLASDDERLYDGALFSLYSLQPKPPQDVIDSCITFLERTDVQDVKRPAAIGVLLKAAPDDDRVRTSIRQFLSRQIDANARMRVYVELATPRFKNSPLAELVASSIDDSNEYVRASAIRTVEKIGGSVLAESKPKLEVIASSPKEAAEVRAAANEALRSLGKSGN